MLDAKHIGQVNALAKRVGDLVLAHQSDPEWRRVLDERKFKTGADQNAHNLLTVGLGKIMPQIPVFSEETEHQIEDRPSQYWLIDPIDGTASWYNGYPGYVIQLALIVDNRPVLGVVYWPAKGILWHGDNTGAFKNGERLNFTQPSRKVPIIVDNYPDPRGLTKTVVDLMPPLDYLESGSIGLKAMLVGDGTADIFIKDILFRDWDIAPAQIILSHLGMPITDFSLEPIKLGTAIQFNEGLLVHRSQTQAKELIDRLRAQHGG